MNQVLNSKDSSIFSKNSSANGIDDIAMADAIKKLLIKRKKPLNVSVGNNG